MIRPRSECSHEAAAGGDVYVPRNHRHGTHLSLAEADAATQRWAPRVLQPVDIGEPDGWQSRHDRQAWGKIALAPDPMWRAHVARSRL
jgi:hypothetical protein